MKKIIAAFIVAFCSNAMANIDEISQSYVKLVLAVGEHDPVYVDAYYGPKQLQEEVKKAKWQLSKIIDDANFSIKQLKQMRDITSLDLRLRKHYLERQLAALVFHAEQLQKKVNNPNYERNFDQEAIALYDTLPPSYDYVHFDGVLSKFDKMLPGKGDVRTRIAALLEKVTIPKDKLDTVFQAAIEGCKKQTLKSMSLPENEDFTLEYVNDKAWSGYNWYQGRFKSLIQINTDFPIRIARAVDLGCHEGYPGHHTYNARLEKSLVIDKGWLELSVYPLFSPQSLIAEGTANYGIEMAYPGDTNVKFQETVLMPLAGLDPTDVKAYSDYLGLMKELSYAGNEVARDYINGNITREEAIELQNKYTFDGRDKAEQRIRFVEKYGAYVINYNWGKDLVKSYLEDAPNMKDRWQRFEALLSSPRIPSSINWK